MRVTSVILIVSYMIVFALGDYLTAFAQDVRSMMDDAAEQIVREVSGIRDINTIAVWHIAPESSGINVTHFEDKILFKLIDTRKFKVIDRQALDRLLKEIELGEAGILDPRFIQKIGKQIGVDGFLYGAIGIEGSSFIARMKLVKTETGVIIWGREISGKDKKYELQNRKAEILRRIPDLEKQITDQRVETGNAIGSSVTLPPLLIGLFGLLVIGLPIAVAAKDIRVAPVVGIITALVAGVPLGVILAISNADTGNSKIKNLENEINRLRSELETVERELATLKE